MKIRTVLCFLFYLPQVTSESNTGAVLVVKYTLLWSNIPNNLEFWVNQLIHLRGPILIILKKMHQRKSLHFSKGLTYLFNVILIFVTEESSICSVDFEVQPNQTWDFRSLTQRFAQFLFLFPWREAVVNSFIYFILKREWQYCYKKALVCILLSQTVQSWLWIW